MRVILLLIGLLSINIFAQQEPAPVLPLWNCWFHTYARGGAGGGRIINLVYGYNNTGSKEVIYSTGSVNNQFTPSSMDGSQTYIFKSGNHPFAFSLSTQSPTLDEAVVWRLNGQSVSVAHSEMTEENRCGVKYGGICPLSIGHFCDDSLFCNGLETCYTPNIIQAMTTNMNGTCSRPHEGVVCPAGFSCSDEGEESGCRDSTPPPPPPVTVIPSFECWYYHIESTNSPMILALLFNYNNTSPTTVVRPITVSGAGVPTGASEYNEISPSLYNMAQPTIFFPGYQARAFTLKDVANVLTSPGGQIQWKLTSQQVSFSRDDITQSNQCNTQGPTGEATIVTTQPEKEEEVIVNTKQCSEENPDCSAYDSFCNGPTRCDTEQGICLQVSSAFSPCHSVSQSVVQGSPVAISCVEHLAICVSSVNCTIDRDCNDGLFCSGRETCQNGTCVMESNFTCGQNQTCVEGVGCVQQNQTLSNPAKAGIIIGVIGGVFIVGSIIGLYFYDKKRISNFGRSSQKSGRDMR